MPIDTGYVKAFIAIHLDSIHSPADVAEHLSLSYHTLRKTFRRQENCTLGRYIRQARIERAKYLLVATDLYCFEICYEVGFHREEVAARTFKEVTGMTMQQYRSHVKESQ